MERKAEEITHIDDTCIFGSAIWSNKAADGEAWVAVLLTVFHVVAPCHWHVVNDPGEKERKKKKKRRKPQYTHSLQSHLTALVGSGFFST